MEKRRENRLKIWEIGLLLGFALTLLWGVWSLRTQDALEEKMIRLHVIANSDSREDQQLKLAVRDEVLADAAAILADSRDMAEARQRLREALPELEAAARRKAAERGCSYPVQARLEPAEFPRKEYDGFALPAGEYLALRVLIGAAEGQNWWCVVYPPLCTAAATDLEETAITAGMAAEDLALMQQENEGYRLKFRSVELWERVRQWLQEKWSRED